MQGTLTIDYLFDLKGHAPSEDQQRDLERHVLDTATPLIAEGVTQGDLAATLSEGSPEVACRGRWRLLAEHHLVSCYELLDNRVALSDHLLENFSFPGPIIDVSAWRCDDDPNHLYATARLDSVGEHTTRRCTFHVRFPDDTSVHPAEAYVHDQDSGDEIGSIDTTGPEVADAIARLA